MAYESLDYDVTYSSFFEKDMLDKTHFQRRLRTVMQWVICMLIGLFTGLVAFLLHTGGAALYKLKNHLAYSVAGDATHTVNEIYDAASYARTCAVYTAFSMLLVALASALVLFVEPIAGGSGIPEVKAYLQGIRLPRMLRVTTLFCKTIGILCSVSAGLVCGQEGPMIHTGAIIGAGVSQGSSKTFRARTHACKRFRNDHDKRDFVSAGAAAGVAAAFGAPIGGVLFAMEEAATHWTQSLTWRTFFCALSAKFALHSLLTAEHAELRFGQLTHPGLLTFVLPQHGSRTIDASRLAPLALLVVLPPDSSGPPCHSMPLHAAPAHLLTGTPIEPRHSRRHSQGSFLECQASPRSHRTRRFGCLPIPLSLIARDAHEPRWCGLLSRASAARRSRGDHLRRLGRLRVHRPHLRPRRRHFQRDEPPPHPVEGPARPDRHREVPERSQRRRPHVARVLLAPLLP